MQDVPGWETLYSGQLCFVEHTEVYVADPQRLHDFFQFQHGFGVAWCGVPVRCGASGGGGDAEGVTFLTSDHGGRGDVDAGAFEGELWIYDPGGDD